MFKIKVKQIKRKTKECKRFCKIKMLKLFYERDKDLMIFTINKKTKSNGKKNELGTRRYE
jgi:hypothetical protein